jgi:hypothetical protein
MSKFRKKPMEIKAWPVRDLYHAAEKSWEKLPQRIVTAYDACDLIFANHPRRIEIKTLDGWMTANIDDWVVEGVKGELYPCKPDIFATTYEPATDISWVARTA